MRLRAALSLPALLSVTVSAMAADPMPRVAPDTVGLSAARLERIGEVLKADVDRGRLPGAVIAIARRGKLAYFEAFGFRDKTANVPMTTDTIFSIASMTKPMTSVAALMLYEESRLLLNDPVGKYLPPVANMQVAALTDENRKGEGAIATVPPRRPMTIQDLLRHTSGLTYGGRGTTAVHKAYPASSNSSAATLTSAEFITKLGTLPLLYQPGSAWDYSLSVDVLGLVVEAISEQTLGAFLQERIWKPLGMVDTGFVVPPGKVSRYARALPNNPDTGRPQPMKDSTAPDKFECGGGCAVSTVGDYIRFGQMLLNKGEFGGARILSRKMVELMTANHLGPEIANNIPAVSAVLAGYGFGLGVAVRTETGITPLAGSAGDFTWGGAFGTSFWVDPKEQLVVVYMAHNPGSVAIRNHYRQAISALVYQALVD